jgi:hypothetical protein
VAETMSDEVPKDPRSDEQPRRLRRPHVPILSPDSYGLILVLIGVTYAVSVALTATWAASLVVAVQIATVWVVLHVSQARRSIRRVATLLLVLAAVTAIVNLFTGDDRTGTGLITFFSVVLYVIAPFSIIRHLVLRRGVDLQTVLGAVDAYLLLGMLFAFLYRFIAVAGSGPFFGPGGDGTLAQDLFFSFTTLTTTGFGNLVPADKLGQTLTVFEMLVGQLFLVTAVARVVNAFQPRRRLEP